MFTVELTRHKDGGDGDYWEDEDGMFWADHSCLSEWFEVPDDCEEVRMVLSEEDSKEAYLFAVPIRYVFSDFIFLRLEDGFNWNRVLMYDTAYKKFAEMQSEGCCFVSLDVEGD